MFEIVVLKLIISFAIVMEDSAETPEIDQAPKEPDAGPENQEGTPDNEEKEEGLTTERDVSEKTAQDQKGQQQPRAV
ncbi:putative zinc finger protein 271 [Lasius niger]|uniref:Putative zinc finger protein 271 n=1 Tax=Lasius niger TaxID=67767 RepID=A0A0J7MUU0_LASNI|nr:putative zinc finger protein 271 [Lasius niger]